MSKQIAYTDTTIRFYTEGWAMERVDKKRYIQKNWLRTSIFFLVTGIPTMIHYREGLTVTLCLVHGLLATSVGLGWAFINYNSMERRYRKFLKYQETKQLENPKPGVFYN